MQLPPGKKTIFVFMTKNMAKADFPPANVSRGTRIGQGSPEGLGWGWF
jgi:hypothetical protein